MNLNFGETFGCKVFNKRIMCERLPKNTYKSLLNSMDKGLPLNPEIAEIVATVMKDWAIEQGATHFTHWFHPMTNITAGKHDSFISPQDDGGVILEFSGKELVKGEPDASSFPNGGLRNTFEARGYTTWDCTSPAFVKDDTLYIPTAFCSYTGEALDTKTPLLRSMEVLSKQALRILKTFGNTTSNRVVSTVGAEQEYFLIDRDNYEKRLDFKLCGRTLFGAKPPKGQEMDDHYCGRIRLRVADYMRQLDSELWKLGVTSKTKHNEVAPTQHELAPIFESANIACDHNQLTMELMRVVAKKNKLACLLHEKPFARINGSGKHNNWSMSTDDGINLLEPGKTPYENVQFLIFLCGVISAVDEYASLLRVSSANPGNDHRLGGHEAPPAIISIFLGEHLTSILENIACGKNNDKISSNILETGVVTLPQLSKDDSDRNRTSPFAFTGNKFEFRMVGSSTSIALANYILNTIIANSLDSFADRLENCKDFDKEVQSIISDTMKNHGKIIFNGNNYTDEWVELAKKRGIPNLSNCVDAIKSFSDKKNIELFEKYNVLSKTETISRYEIMLENYSKTIKIEANVMLEMTKKQIIPSLIKYVGKISKSYNELNKTGINNNSIKDLINKISISIEKISETVEKLKNQVETTNNISDSKEQAEDFRDSVCPIMETLRNYVDNIENSVENQSWPMPTYVDLLHRV